MIMYKKMKDEELEFVVGGLYTPIVKKKYYHANNLDKKKSSKVNVGENKGISEKNVLA